MKKGIEKIRKNIKTICILVLGIALGGVGVGAVSIASKDVSYTNASSSVTNVQGAIEELYGKLQFQYHFPNLTENGWRYTGANPNNYVSFNGELWRIIGIFDGKIKIIRNASIGSMAWNSTANNDWKSSSLYGYLNTIYYNGIKAPYKNMIENATWRTGGWIISTITTAQMYGYEGNTPGKGSSTTTATGYIGLMSISDYGYASSECYGGSQTLYDYNNSTCTSTNWLKSGPTEWTITPSSSTASYALYVLSGGDVGFSTYVTSAFAVRPSLYLKSNVYITGGTGTSTNPYTISQ